MNRTAQAWGIDLTIASVIFILGIITFYLYSLNSSSETDEGLNKILYDSNVIANELFSEGSPANWTQSNIARIGIFTDNKIDSMKLGRLYDFTQSDYNRTKILFNIDYDYLVEFSRQLNTGTGNITSLGYPGVTNISQVTSDNLVKVTRFAAYQGDIVTVNIYVWGEK